MESLETRAPNVSKAQEEKSIRRAAFTVEDNGSGIPPEKLGAIFDAYYTTKPAGKGTGLGLAVVKRIVESYGGSITVTSREGVGTAMHFDLPMTNP